MGWGSQYFMASNIGETGMSLTTEDNGNYEAGNIASSRLVLRKLNQAGLQMLVPEEAVIGLSIALCQWLLPRKVQDKHGKQTYSLPHRS
jgi:hypothetical protein